MPYKDPEKQRKYWREWYNRNAKKKREISAQVQQRKRKIKQWYSAYKATLQCEVCEESHPSTLDFHHDDPKEKFLGIHRMAGIGYSKERIIEEINKCRVLCRNCHMDHHYQNDRNQFSEDSDELYGKSANYQRRKRTFMFVERQLDDASCKKCGETRNQCLEFHHREPDDSMLQISYLKGNTYSIETIKREMEKCDIICGNCHRKLHWP